MPTALRDGGQVSSATRGETMHSSRRLRNALVAALAIGAISAPAANAMTGEQFRASSGSDSTPSKQSSQPAPTVTRTVDDGFDLGSAAIGAGSAAAVLLVAGAGATAASRHRRRVRPVG
jgi:hypothetical protein